LRLSTLASFKVALDPLSVLVLDGGLNPVNALDTMSQAETDE
jgi:hypothetical protein